MKHLSVCSAWIINSRCHKHYHDCVGGGVNKGERIRLSAFILSLHCPRENFEKTSSVL